MYFKRVLCYFSPSALSELPGVKFGPICRYTGMNGIISKLKTLKNIHNQGLHIEWIKGWDVTFGPS